MRKLQNLRVILKLRGWERKYCEGDVLGPPSCLKFGANLKTPKTNNAVEGWHRAMKGSLGYVHPTIFKFIDFLRREQSAAENKLISFQAGKEFPKNARYQKNAPRIKNILEGYQKQSN